MRSNNTSDELEARSPKGLAILTHAISDGGKVLEFNQQDDGTITILDITDHVNELEQQHSEGSTSSEE